MMPRRLGQIWQFGLGSVWAVIGMISLIAFAGMHFLLPPPSLNELRSVSGALIDRIHVHRPSKGGPWVSFALSTAEGRIEARINNYGFLWGCNETPALLTLVPGDQIAARFSEKDIADHTQAVTWEIQKDGIALLTFEQSLAAHYEQEKRLAYLAIGILIIGAALSFWGWRIYLSDRRKFGNVL